MTPPDYSRRTLLTTSKGGVVLAEIGNNGRDFQDDVLDPSPGFIESGGG